jgi:hypothetical protein
MAEDETVLKQEGVADHEKDEVLVELYKKYTSHMGPDGKGFMAKVLAQALGMKEYDEIRVTGYPSKVEVRPSQRYYLSTTFYARKERWISYEGSAKDLDSTGKEVEAYHPFPERSRSRRIVRREPGARRRTPIESRPRCDRRRRMDGIGRLKPVLHFPGGGDVTRPGV